MSSWERSRLELAYQACVVLALLAAGVAAFTRNPFNLGLTGPPAGLADDPEVLGIAHIDSDYGLPVSSPA